MNSLSSPIPPKVESGPTTWLDPSTSYRPQYRSTFRNMSIYVIVRAIGFRVGRGRLVFTCLQLSDKSPQVLSRMR